MMPSRKEGSRSHIRTYDGIELLRFFTAVAVLVFHYQHLYNDSGIGLDVTQQPFYSVLEPVYHYGYFGVQIFWCISGFIFFARYGRSVGSGEESIRSFALARFSRLYPLHLLTLLAVAAMQWVYVGRHGSGFVYQNNDPGHFLAQLAMAGSWQLASGPGTYSFNGPFWSVSLEILAYAVFFAVTRFFGASLRTVLSTLVVVVALDTFGRHHPVFTCIVYFYIGAGVFKLSDALATARARTAAVALALAVMVAAAVTTSLSKLPASVATLAIAPAALIVSAMVRRGRATRFGDFAMVLGNTTYASYLLHFPLQLLCVLILEQAGIERPLGSAWFFVGYVVITFLLAMLCHRFIEWPAQQWLRLRYGRPRPVGRIV